MSTEKCNCWECRRDRDKARLDRELAKMRIDLDDLERDARRKRREPMVRAVYERGCELNIEESLEDGELLGDDDEAFKRYLDDVERSFKTNPQRRALYERRQAVRTVRTDPVYRMDREKLYRGVAKFGASKGISGVSAYKAYAEHLRAGGDPLA